MTRFGYALSSEEFGPQDLLRQASLAEDHGMAALWISDHYHPWVDAQGQSPFVWSVLGALAVTCRLPVMTAVTCPIMRIHPAVLAQAAATTAVLHEGRFALGVGTGEALNEHVVGRHWPSEDVRLEMLEEAVEVLRELWTGELVDHRGRHYTVENARIYTRPPNPPRVLVSAFGPKAVRVAARIGDGYVSTKPSAELIQAYRDGGGSGPTMGQLKFCWAPTQDEGVKIAHRTWPNSALPGELAQELPQPAHFEQASSIVTEDMVREQTPAGPDPEPYLRSLRTYLEAGYDELYVTNIGPYQDEFFRFWERELHPQLA